MASIQSKKSPNVGESETSSCKLAKLQTPNSRFFYLQTPKQFISPAIEKPLEAASSEIASVCDTATCMYGKLCTNMGFWVRWVGDGMDVGGRGCERAESICDITPMACGYCLTPILSSCESLLSMQSGLVVRLATTDDGISTKKCCNSVDLKRATP
jgi:hypothetical protein